MAKDRSADRHDPSKETSVSARLASADVARLDAACATLGLRSRRQGVIAAIREWLDKHAPETTEGQ